MHFDMLAYFVLGEMAHTETARLLDYARFIVEFGYGSPELQTALARFVELGDVGMYDVLEQQKSGLAYVIATVLVCLALLLMAFGVRWILGL